MKKYKEVIGICFGIGIYFLIATIKHIYIPCIFHLVTHLYCPGCGVTRMIMALIKGNFYQAFRYNMLLFILFPIFGFYILNYFYSLVKNKTPLYLKIPNWILYTLIVIFISFAIIRNIFPYFGPIKI